MTTVSDRYERLAGAFLAKIEAVPPDRWSAPSPCDGWTARDVVRHVVATQGFFEQLVGRDIGDLPSVDDDPAGAWRAASAVVLGDLRQPDRAAAEYDGLGGRSTFEAAVDRFLCMDLVVHAWDLARAAGLDERMDPDDVGQVQATAEGFGEGMRSPQAFGPAVEPPPGAGPQEHLLAFLGRRV